MIMPEGIRATSPSDLACLLAIGLTLVLLGLGLGGFYTAGIGFGLFIIAGLFLGAGIGCAVIFAFTRRFAGDALLESAKWLLILGGWAYVASLSTLGGFYIREALAGRITYKWIVFGPVILGALIILDFGLYRVLVKKQLPTFNRYRGVISRDNVEPEALRRTLVNEVVLQRTLRSVSGFRWLRHTLIFWGFTLMFAVELLAVVFRDALPAFGMSDIYADLHHPIRAGFKFAFELTGLMMLAGCIMALYWRVKVQGTELQKYTDTPTTLFIFVVVSSGFVLEAWHIAALGRNPALAISFIGYPLSFALPSSIVFEGRVHNILWLAHVLAACAFIAYIPVWRLVHLCATPLGRLMNSQRRMLAKKKESSLRGLMSRRVT